MLLPSARDSYAANVVSLQPSACYAANVAALQPSARYAASVAASSSASAATSSSAASNNSNSGNGQKTPNSSGIKDNNNSNSNSNGIPVGNPFFTQINTDPNLSSVSQNSSEFSHPNNKQSSDNKNLQDDQNRKQENSNGTFGFRTDTMQSNHGGNDDKQASSASGLVNAAGITLSKLANLASMQQNSVLENTKAGQSYGQSNNNNNKFTIKKSYVY